MSVIEAQTTFPYLLDYTVVVFFFVGVCERERPCDGQSQFLAGALTPNMNGLVRVGSNRVLVVPGRSYSQLRARVGVPEESSAIY